MMDEHRDDRLSDAFGRALDEAAQTAWHRDAAPDLRARAQRRRRGQIIGVVASVLLLGSAIVGWSVVLGAGPHGGGERAPVTAPPTIDPPTTTTTLLPCPDEPDPSDPCALPGGVAPGARAWPR